MMDVVSSLTWMDWCLLAIVLTSLTLGVVRGVVREIFSLIGWVAAFWLAKSYGMMGAHWLIPFVGSETIRMMAGFALFFIAGLILTALLGHIVNAMVTSAGLGVLNRVLGGLFGMLRGALFVVILVLLAGMTALPAQREWRSSLFIDWAERGGKLLMPYLPDSMAQRVHF